MTKGTLSHQHCMPTQLSLYSSLKLSLSQHKDAKIFEILKTI